MHISPLANYAIGINLLLLVGVQIKYLAGF